MTSSLATHVGQSAEAMARRFIAAWHRAERHLRSRVAKAFPVVLTGKRLEILRHLHRHAACKAWGSDRRPAAWSRPGRRSRGRRPDPIA